MGAILPSGLSFLVVRAAWLWLFNQIADGFLHVGVLAHEHMGIDGSELASEDGDLL